jgi:hypothetical protein
MATGNKVYAVIKEGTKVTRNTNRWRNKDQAVDEAIELANKELCNHVVIYCMSNEIIFRALPEPLTSVS